MPEKIETAVNDGFSERMVKREKRSRSAREMREVWVEEVMRRREEPVELTREAA